MPIGIVALIRRLPFWTPQRKESLTHPHAESPLTRNLLEDWHKLRFFDEETDFTLLVTIAKELLPEIRFPACDSMDIRVRNCTLAIVFTEEPISMESLSEPRLCINCSCFMQARS